jgi:hypothetical protein
MTVRYGLGVRIAGSHPAGPGSIPGTGIKLFLLSILPPPGIIGWTFRCIKAKACELGQTDGEILLGQPNLEPVSPERTEEKNVPTRMGFEPTRAEHIGLAVQRLNHSATSSSLHK